VVASAVVDGGKARRAVMAIRMGILMVGCRRKGGRRITCQAVIV
jgi:hypothetical protein